MKPIDFCKIHSACSEGTRFAHKFETMAEVWDACEQPSWLFWMLRRQAPLAQDQSVRLAIAFAETCLQFVPTKEQRPALAIRAAKNWLDNPCPETRDAADAYAAADAAADAAYAAAADAAAAYAADAAADAAAAVRKGQCDLIRNAVKNPFTA